MRGTDLMTHVVERAARENVPIALYGGTPESLEALVQGSRGSFPRGAGGVPDLAAISSVDPRGRRGGNRRDHRHLERASCS